MSWVSITDLRNHGGEIVDRTARGEQITITRTGKPVAELRAVARQPLSADVLCERRRRLPPLDARELRADLDRALGASL